VDKKNILGKIKKTESPLKKQLLMTALITSMLEEKGYPAPILIGGLALSYYTREVYFTADIDLAYGNSEALNDVLNELGFKKRGRYWITKELDIAVETPTSGLAGENAPLETVELDFGLHCKIIGIEDLLIDRLNSCKHWEYEIDCEMAELLVIRYGKEMKWDYLESKAKQPENDIWEELRIMKEKSSYGK
jgi:hypothetical protein